MPQSRCEAQKPAVQHFGGLLTMVANERRINVPAYRTCKNFQNRTCKSHAGPCQNAPKGSWVMLSFESNSSEAAGRKRAAVTAGEAIPIAPQVTPYTWCQSTSLLGNFPASRYFLGCSHPRMLSGKAGCISCALGFLPHHKNIRSFSFQYFKGLV